jgi:hypothetical protein
LATKAALSITPTRIPQPLHALMGVIWLHHLLSFSRT